MPPDPAGLKPDPRTPEQLAQAILEHEFSPESQMGVFKRVSFGEQLEYNAAQETHPAALLLASLQILAQGRSLSPQDKLDVSHGLEVIAAYREDSTRSRDMYAMHANPDRIPGNEEQEMACRTHEIYGRPDSDAQREAQEDMATSAVEIGNLKSLERLLRTLAAHPKVNVKLIEPGRSPRPAVNHSLRHRRRRFRVSAGGAICALKVTM
jgi:hypothetical protein